VGCREPDHKGETGWVSGSLLSLYNLGNLNTWH
jgi:hypothetical protein